MERGARRRGHSRSNFLNGLSVDDLTTVAEREKGAGVPTNQLSVERGEERNKTRSARSRWLLGGLLVALIPTVYFFSQLARPGGLLNLIQFGTQFEASSVPDVAGLHPPRDFLHGYDAQYYAQIAMDPFLRDPRTGAAVDDAGYRARRIFLPLISNVLGFGNPALTLNILASLNYVFFLALLGAVILAVRPTSPPLWAVVAAAVLTTGTMDSLHRALSDLPAATLIFVAVVFPLAATRIALLATAILTRETAVLSAIPCVIGLPLFERRNFVRLCAVVLPAVAWYVYLFLHLRSWGGGPDGNFELPGAAIVQRVAVGWSDFLERPNDRRFFLLLTPICLVVQAIYLWRFPKLDSALWWSGIAFTALLFILGPQVWVGNIAATRVLLPMTIAFNVLLAVQRPAHFWPWFVAGNAGLLWGLRKLTIDLGMT